MTVIKFVQICRRSDGLKLVFLDPANSGEIIYEKQFLIDTVANVDMGEE